MQFQTIIASLAFAVLATAAPAPAPNGGSWDVPGQDAQNQCGSGQTAACCNTAVNIVGGNCNALILSNLISSQCSQQSTVACCASNTNQAGTINVALPCIPIAANLL